jgi:hypothetical protein
MELETQNHVCTNQLRRQDEEIKRLREEKETCSQVRKMLAQTIFHNDFDFFSDGERPQGRDAGQ